jgi:hypothetical protein
MHNTRGVYNTLTSSQCAAALSQMPPPLPFYRMVCVDLHECVGRWPGRPTRRKIPSLVGRRISSGESRFVHACSTQHLLAIPNPPRCPFRDAPSPWAGSLALLSNPERLAWVLPVIIIKV